MPDDSIIGQYARMVVDDGTSPVLRGLTFACRVTGVTAPSPSERRSVFRAEIVSTDTDPPLPSRIMKGSVLITPEDAEATEARILGGGSFRAKLDLVGLSGELIAAGEGSLVRVSGDVPFDNTCPACQGWKMCEDCAGTGGEPPAMCPYCHGAGVCARCAGSGFVPESDGASR